MDITDAGTVKTSGGGGRSGYEKIWQDRTQQERKRRGGAISSNTVKTYTNSYGGGVYVASGGAFIKAGGTIYGGETPSLLDGTVLKNTRSRSDRAYSGGDGVYAAAGSKKRDTT
jgi:hypothetical protein